MTMTDRRTVHAGFARDILGCVGEPPDGLLKQVICEEAMERYYRRFVRCVGWIVCRLLMLV